MFQQVYTTKSMKKLWLTIVIKIFQKSIGLKGVTVRAIDAAFQISDEPSATFKRTFDL